MTAERDFAHNPPHMHRSPTRSQFDLLLRWEFPKDPLPTDQGVGLNSSAYPSKGGRWASNLR